MKSLSGVLNIRKPAGMTSRDVVNHVQRLIRPVKTGHAGTLDPLATGVLLVAVGPATRLISVLQKESKTYRAEFTLGCTSDTDDNTGIIIRHEHLAAKPTLAQIEHHLQQMTGRIQQVPPAYSAVHVDGQRAYDLARRGQEFSLAAKEVEVHAIRIHDYAWPVLDVEIDCGSGTYIRSIARDLGLNLGCGALMSRLERTRIGRFDLQSATDLSELSATRIPCLLIPSVQIVASLPQHDCTSAEAVAVRQGKSLRIQESSLCSCPDKGATIALTSQNGTVLIALAEMRDGRVAQPRTVFPETE